jgi:hypothetical protein
VRTYTSRPGVSLNLEQQVSEVVGVFARAGWADGTIEPWDFTDIDKTVSAGVSLNGKQWGRPNDTIGVAGIVNNIAPVHQAFFNAGGLGILIGDGQLPNPGLEEIFETYYSYGFTEATKVTFDYQFVNNPAYNTQRGPVNAFAGCTRSSKVRHETGTSDEGSNPVMSTAREHAHAIELAPADESKAVVLNLVGPLRADRRGVGDGRQARLDEAGRTADGARSVPAHPDLISVERA